MDLQGSLATTNLLSKFRVSLHLLKTVFEIILLSPQFSQFGRRLGSFVAFFNIINFLVHPLKVENLLFFAMYVIHMTSRLLHQSGFFWFSERTVRTTIRFPVFIQSDLIFDLPKKFSIEIAVSRFWTYCSITSSISWSSFSWVSVEVVADLQEVPLIWMIPSASKFFSLVFSKGRTALLFGSCSFQGFIFQWVLASHPLRPCQHHHLREWINRSTRWTNLY